jgi:hypothetical protein
MTHRANQSLAAAGILAVLLALLAFHIWDGGSPVVEVIAESVDDDDSGDDDSGDDDSAPFSNLPELPKE